MTGVAAQRTSPRETPWRARPGGTRVARKAQTTARRGGPWDEVRRRAAAHRPGQAGDRGDPPPARPRPRSVVAGAEWQRPRPELQPRPGRNRPPERAPACRERAPTGIGRGSRHPGGRGHRGVGVVCRPDRSIGAKPGIRARGHRWDFHCPVRSGAGSGPGQGCPGVGGNRSAGDGGVETARCPDRGACHNPRERAARAERRPASGWTRRRQPSGPRWDRGPAPAMERSPGHSVQDRRARRPAVDSIGAAHADPGSITPARAAAGDLG
jgi:hypothetical protein